MVGTRPHPLRDGFDPLRHLNCTIMNINIFGLRIESIQNNPQQITAVSVHLVFRAYCSIFCPTRQIAERAFSRFLHLVPWKKSQYDPPCLIWSFWLTIWGHQWTLVPTFKHSTAEIWVYLDPFPSSDAAFLVLVLGSEISPLTDHHKYQTTIFAGTAASTIGFG
jgi:hypothetical protein